MLRAAKTKPKPPEPPPSTLASPRSWSVPIPGWQPTSLNRLLGNPFAAARLKRKDAEAIGIACSLVGVPRVRIHHVEAEYRKLLGMDAKQPGDPIPVKRRVRLEITLAKHQRALDSDNLWKSLLDGLKRSGMLYDDNRVWCEHDASIEYRRGKDENDKGTVIVIEDVLPPNGD